MVARFISAESVPYVHRFKKKTAFDRVWHAASWVTMRKYNINANLVHAVEHLYDKAIRAVQMNGSISHIVNDIFIALPMIQKPIYAS